MTLPRRRTFNRIGVAALLLPIAVGAGAPVEPTPVRAHTDALLTRALSVMPADSTQPVASVTVLPRRWREHLRPGPVARRGVPAAALRAYVAAEATMRVADPSCRLRWSLLAGIGQVESRHGRVGPDRLGPMQFVPATWNVVGVDADGDGGRDPQDVDDAALAAAAYLCAGPGDLGMRRGAREAVVTYNRSPGYADAVLALSDAYRRIVDDLPAVATAALSTGTGVTVGVGSPGQGVLVGGSDDVAADTAGTPPPAAGNGASGPASAKNAPERGRPDRRGDDRTAADTETRRERDRAPSPRDRRDASPSPAPRRGPVPTRKPDAKPTPRPTGKPSPTPRPKRPGKPPAPVEVTRTGTVAEDAAGYHLVMADGARLLLTGSENLGSFVGLLVTVSGVVDEDENTLTLSTDPVPAG